MVVVDGRVCMVGGLWYLTVSENGVFMVREKVYEWELREIGHMIDEEA